MKKVTRGLVSGLLVASMVAFVGLFSPLTPAASAQSCGDVNGGIQSGVSCGQTGNTPSDLFGASGIFTLIINILLFIIGIVSVVMLIIGGIRYTISGGDSGQVTAAKNTILYAIIGLVIAFLAFAIVNFVIGQLGANTN